MLLHGAVQQPIYLANPKTNPSHKVFSGYVFLRFHEDVHHLFTELQSVVVRVEPEK
jgi:hypothetical protein